MHPLYKFTDCSLYIINRMNTTIGIYRYFGEQLSDMFYFHRQRKLLALKENKFTMSFF